MSGWGRRRKERLLFVSRRAVFQAPEWEVGRLVEHRGDLFLVTRWVELPPTRNARGASIPQWEVWGRPAREGEAADEMAEAVTRILQGTGEDDEGAAGGG